MGSQVIDALEAQEIKETGNEEKVSTAAAKSTRNFRDHKLTIGLDLGDPTNVAGAHPNSSASSRRRLIGCMGATEFAPKIRKRYQTNELAVDSTEFGTRRSEVQILSPRPFLIFYSFKDQVERLSIDRPQTYAVRVAVQNHRFQQLSAFFVVPRKIKKMRSVKVCATGGAGVNC